MNFGNLGFGEIVVLLILVLLLFGAKRLPEIGASMGKGIREFKRSITDAGDALREPAPRDRLAPGEREPYRDRPAATTKTGRSRSGCGRKGGVWGLGYRVSEKQSGGHSH